MVGLLCRCLLKKVNISLHPFCYGVFIIAPLKQWRDDGKRARETDYTPVSKWHLQQSGS